MQVEQHLAVAFALLTVLAVIVPRRPVILVEIWNYLDASKA